MTFVTLSLHQLWSLLALTAFSMLMLWTAIYRKDLRDLYLLRRYGNKCVRARIHTRRGLVERVVVPDEHNGFSVDGESHLYDQRQAVWDRRRQIHVVDIISGSVPPGVKTWTTEGGHVYVHAGTPSPVGISAQDMESLIRSRITAGIAAATTKELRQLNAMYFLLLASLVLVFLSMGLTWWLFSGLEADLKALIFSLYNQQGA